MRDLQCLHAAEGGVVIHQEIKAGRFQTPLPLFLAPEFRALRNRRFIGLFVKAAPMRVIQSRSEEHTSELQSLMRISYAVFCLKKKNNRDINNSSTHRSSIQI